MTFKSLDEHLKDAEALVKQHGFLPHCTWLRNNGFQALYQMVHLHKDDFSHFPRNRKYRRLEDWVVEARKLAKKHKGILPRVSWLLKNNYGMLCRQMQKHPEAFKGIKQERNFRRPEEWVTVAEKIAKAKGGTLPNTYWLQRNGYKALDKTIRQHPDLFEHIDQSAHRAVVEV